MPAITIGLDFLTGRCVAASVYDRDVPEWPPHPGRVFMALAAACFETGEDPEEVAALTWLEALPAPEVYASESFNRSRVTNFVPVNYDRYTVTPKDGPLQSAPGFSRLRQARAYPTAIPLDSTVKLVWTPADEGETHFKALSNLCASVIRVGHSSSLVRAWAELSEPDPEQEHTQNRIRWQPTAKHSKWKARIAGAGELERLRIACQADRIQQFAELKMEVESAKGAAKKKAKQVFETVVGEPYRNSARAPEPTPATLGLWQGYRMIDPFPQEQTQIDGEYFDVELLILTRQDGRNIGIQDCLALTSRLREAAMSRCPKTPPPAWLGGHDPETNKPTEQPHTAFLALPFVGREHADGHLMGLALALPKSVPLEERGPLLAPLLFDEEDNPRKIELKLGNLGTWELRLEERPEPPLSLQNDSWTRPSETWASVTPVVLDKFPKAARDKNRKKWETEVRGIIAQSCLHAGLPEPVEIDLDTTSWHIGAPRAFAKSRPLRSREPQGEQRANLSDGFPNMPARAGKPSRLQIHVHLRFAGKVRGPVLLGAGRFLGYGLCKPIKPNRKTP